MQRGGQVVGDLAADRHDAAGAALSGKTGRRERGGKSEAAGEPLSILSLAPDQNQTVDLCCEAAGFWLLMGAPCSGFNKNT